MHDVFVFYKAPLTKSPKMRNALEQFSQITFQEISYYKLAYQFSKGISNTMKKHDQIKYLDERDEQHGKYLGMLMFLEKSKA